MLLYLAVSFSGIFMLLEFSRVSKFISRFLALTPLFFLFSILSFNRMNRDYWFYQYAFVDERYRTQLEFGYAYLVKTAAKLGFDHTAIVFLAGVLLIFTFHKMLKTSRNLNFVIFFYCAFPLIYDINQTRNLFMYLIVILSLLFIESGKPIKHYLTLFIAFSMHSFALIYAPFYFLCKLTRKKYMSLLWKITIVFGLSSPLVLKALSLIFPVKMAAYMARPTQIDALIYIVYFIIDVFTIWWIDKKISGKIFEEDNRKMEILYRFVWFSMLVLPFIFYFGEINRLQRNALLVKYIYCAIAMKYLTFKQKIFVLGLLIISIIIYLLMLKYFNNTDLFSYLDANYIKYYFESNF